MNRTAHILFAADAALSVDITPRTSTVVESAVILIGTEKVADNLPPLTTLLLLDTSVITAVPPTLKAVDSLSLLVLPALTCTILNPIIYNPLFKDNEIREMLRR